MQRTQDSTHPPLFDPMLDRVDRVDRRGFLRLLGAASLPLLGQGCDRGDELPGPREQFRAVNPPGELAIDVLRAKSTQSILGEQEQLSIDNNLALTLSLGDQCRVIAPNGEQALYTVGDVRGEQGDDRCRMGLAARMRLGYSNPFAATLSTFVVAPDDMTDAQAEAAGEFVERLVDDGVSAGLVVIAPHGGNIERYTDIQAAHTQSRLANTGASSWICKGYKPGGGAYNRWHITSTDISRQSFPGLDQIADRGFAYAVSYHGFSHDMILVGGGAPHALRQEIADAIAVATQGAVIIAVASAEDGYNGDSPSNVVNWLTSGGVSGVQVEQSAYAREMYGIAIADAVADVFEGYL